MSCGICDKTCEKCIHYGVQTLTCNYILHTGHRRGCPAGKGCTRRKTGSRSRRHWDKETAYELWKQGMSDAAIARAVKVSAQTIGNTRKKEWMNHETRT